MIIIIIIIIIILPCCTRMQVKYTVVCQFVCI